MTDELKPCPFCGSPAELEDGSDHHGTWFNLGCSRHWGHQRNPDHKNTCIAGRMFYTETDVPVSAAIAAWNTRADDARIEALEQRVRELEEALKPFAFLEMEKAEGLADTQYVWEAIYRDRVQDWIAFEDIDTARKALG